MKMDGNAWFDLMFYGLIGGVMNVGFFFSYFVLFQLGLLGSLFVSGIGVALYLILIYALMQRSEDE